jgi:hypothetical protein
MDRSTSNKEMSEKLKKAQSLEDYVMAFFVE